MKRAIFVVLPRVEPNRRPAARAVAVRLPGAVAVLIRAEAASVVPLERELAGGAARASRMPPYFCVCVRERKRLWCFVDVVDPQHSPVGRGDFHEVGREDLVVEL